MMTTMRDAAAARLALNTGPFAEWQHPRFRGKWVPKAVGQKRSSKRTSINASKLPTVFSRVRFVAGSKNADIGGGKFDIATEKLKTLGVENIIYDKFNRSEEWNNEALAKIRGGKCDTATIANVLNVIEEAEARDDVIMLAADVLKPEGVAYFQIYEGDGSGQGKQTGEDSWQNNRKTEAYIGEIEKVFESVIRSGNIIAARKPRPAFNRLFSLRDAAVLNAFGSKYQEYLHPRLRGRFTRKPEVGDKVLFKSPHVPESEDANYRGQNEDKAVLVTKRGSQIAVPLEWISEHPEVKRENFRKYIEELKRETDEWVQSNLDAAGEARVIKMDWVYHGETVPGKYVVIAKNPSEPNKWQATAFTDGEPWGHDIFDTRDDAITSYSGKRVKGHGPAHASSGTWKVSETRNRFLEVIANQIALNAKAGSKYQEYLHPRLKGKWRSKGLVRSPVRPKYSAQQIRSQKEAEAQQQETIAPAAPGAQTTTPSQGQEAQASTAPAPEVAAGEYAWKTDKERRGRKSGRDPRATIAYKAQEIAKLCEQFDNYKDWYKECQGTLTELFDGAVETFVKILTATSQAATVKSNVALAIKAYRQLLNGEMFEGFMAPVRENLERIKKGLDPIGPKIAEYGKAMTTGEGIPVDRHIFQLLYHTKGSKPSEAQIEKAKGVIRNTAQELGWSPSQVQASLWAAHIVKTNEKAETYHHRLKVLHEQGKLANILKAG